MSDVSESTVDPWFGRLPVGWSIKRLGALGTLIKGRGGSKEDNRDAGVPVVRYGDLYTKFDITIDEPAAFVSEEDAARYTPLPRHSIVFAASGESAEDIGKSAMSLLAEPAVVGGDAVVFHPNNEIDSLYLAYALESSPVRAYKAIRSTGFTVVHISAGKLKTLPIPFPSHAEQRAIADYLDRETARIDTLIEEQQRLIEMLRERRDGVVTKTFLNSTERERKLKYLVDDVTVGIVVQPSRWYVDAGVPALRGVNVERGSISLADLVSISEEGHAAHPKSQLRSGDVVVVRTGQAGAAAKIPDELDGVNAIDLLIVRPGENTDPDFLVWYLNSPLAASRIEHGSVGAIQGHFNVSALRELSLPDVTLDEQRRIVGYLDAQIPKIDTTIAETERFIELAQERRSALITAAVMGQIDVREAA